MLKVLQIPERGYDLFKALKNKGFLSIGLDVDEKLYKMNRKHSNQIKCLKNKEKSRFKSGL